MTDPEPRLTLRERLMPWVMAAVRLGAGWLLCAGTLRSIGTPGAPLLAPAGPLAAAALALLMLLALLAFAWPRSCLYGAAALAASLAAANWLWRAAGLEPPPLATALAVVGVLALGEWLNRRVQRRFGRP